MHYQAPVQIADIFDDCVISPKLCDSRLAVSESFQQLFVFESGVREVVPDHPLDKGVPEEVDRKGLSNGGELM